MNVETITDDEITSNAAQDNVVRSMAVERISHSQLMDLCEVQDTG